MRLLELQCCCCNSELHHFFALLPERCKGMHYLFLELILSFFLNLFFEKREKRKIMSNCQLSLLPDFGNKYGFIHIKHSALHFTSKGFGNITKIIIKKMRRHITRRLNQYRIVMRAPKNIDVTSQLRF